MGGLLSRGPTHLSKASLMFAIEDLVPQTNQVDDQINQEANEENVLGDVGTAELIQETGQEPPPEEEAKDAT